MLVTVSVQEDVMAEEIVGHGEGDEWHVIEAGSRDNDAECEREISVGLGYVVV